MVLLGDQFAGKRVVKTVEDKLHHAEKRADRVLVQRVDLVGVAQRRLLDVFVGNLHMDHVQDVVQVELNAIVERLGNRPRKQLVRKFLASLGYVRPDLLLNASRRREMSRSSADTSSGRESPRMGREWAGVWRSSPSSSCDTSSPLVELCSLSPDRRP